MDLIQFRIHPSVGMARFGESKEWYFLGSEFPRYMQEQFPNLRHKSVALRHPDAPSGPVPSKPADGVFRDAAGHVMPQAARFRVFAYVFNVGSREPYKVVELTSADADIEWTVTLANRKTVRSATNKVDVNDPAPVTLKTNPASAPSNCKKPGDYPNLAWLALEAGTGRLHVLGNEGEDKKVSSSPPAPRLFQFNWFDTAADGPVTAVVKPKVGFLSRFAGFKYFIPGEKDPQNLPGSGAVDALSAWVVVNMPDYVPDFGHIVSLWDLALALSWKHTVDGKVSPVDGRHFLAKSGEVNDYAFYDYYTHIHPVLTVFMDVNWTSGQARNGAGEKPDTHETGIVSEETLDADATASGVTLKTDQNAAFRLKVAALIDPAKTPPFKPFNIVLTPTSGEPFAAGHEIVTCSAIADDGTLTVTRGTSGTAAADWPDGTSFFAAPAGTFFEADLKVDAASGDNILKVEPVAAHKMRQPTGVAGDLNEGPFFMVLTDGSKFEWVKCTRNDKREVPSAPGIAKLTVTRAQLGTAAQDWDASTTTLIAAGGGHKNYDARKHMSALASGARGPAHKRIFERLRRPRTVYERTTFNVLVGSGTTPFPRQYGRRYDIGGADGIDTVSGDPTKINSMIPASTGIDPAGSLAPHWPRFAGFERNACKGDDMGTGETEIEQLDDMYWIATERDMPMLKEYAVTHLQYNQFEYWATGKFEAGPKLRWAPLFGVLFDSSAIGAFLRTAGRTAEEYFREFAKRLPRYTPAMLDMAHLGEMLGGSFLPGIEVGREGGKPENWSLVHGATKYFPDIRFHPANGSTPHKPGMLTKDLAVPWFNDFISCDETYWPTSRPQIVYEEHGFAYQWLSGARDTPDYWRKVGFIRRAAPTSDVFIEQERLLPRP